MLKVFDFGEMKDSAEDPELNPMRTGGEGMFFTLLEVFGA